MQVMKLSEYKKQHGLNNTHLMNIFNEPSRQNVQNWCKNGWYVIVNADHNDAYLELVSPKRKAVKTLEEVKKV